MTRFVFIRHGATEGNLSGRYVGRTDEPLCQTGREALQEAVMQQLYPEAESGALLFVSPMKRCIETASILYPGMEQRIVQDFCECDFGDFEYRNYREMNGDPVYQAWIDSGGTAPFPGGEDPEAFRLRSVRAFSEIRKQAGGCPQLLLVVHGGTIMSILSAFSDPPSDYFDWQTGNGQGFLCSSPDGERLEGIRPL